MKIPLRYQVCETDCGITTVLNALNYLYQREQIDPSLITKILNLNKIADINVKHNDYKYGMSKYAMKYIERLINNYSGENNFNLITKYISKKNIKIQDNEVIECLKKGGVVIARVWQDCEHYSLIVKIDSKYVYIFDPYFLDKNEYNNDNEIQMIFDRPFEYNRKVSISRLNSDSNLDFALVNNENRDLLLMWKKDI